MIHDSSNVIRITKEEASSAHVDDLLKRQMSMRGEPGVTRDRRRKWYFQNWIVLALVGALGAFAAWSMHEPFFDDQLYVQGTIEQLDLADSLPERIVEKDRAFQLADIVAGSMRINGDRIYLSGAVREVRGNDVLGHVDTTKLKNGDVVGVYVEYHPGLERDLAFARSIVFKPAPRGDAEEKMTLRQLHSRSNAASLITFSVVAGMIGLFIGAVDGFICRLPRRALLAGGVGLVVGCLGGFICSIFANLAYAPLHSLAVGQMGSGGALGAFGFGVQMGGRSLAWGLAGLAMGLGQGIALRSGRLLVYGMIGGVVGGLLGGMLFDPIDLLLLGSDKPSAHWSRMIGFVVIGGTVGGMIGLVELLARDAWLRMTQGPLTGKEFLLFKDVMTIGSSPRSDLYLFNDPQVAKHHAVIRSTADECEIEAKETGSPVLLNNRPVQRARLRHGDNVTIGRATFVFQRRKS